jgi:hypothetical protein
MEIHHVKVRALVFAMLALVALAVVPSASAAAPATAVHATSPLSRYMTYLNWSLDHGDKVMSILNDLQFDLEITDYDSGIVDATRLKNETRRGINWLNAYKPAACYRSVWTYEMSYLTHTNLSAQYTIKGLRSISAYWINRATSETKIATRQINRLTAALGKTSC